MKNINIMKKRIEKMKADQKALAMTVSSLKLTIAEMTEQEKDLIEKLMTQQFNSNEVNAKKLAKLRRLIETEQLATVVESASPEANVEQLANIIDVVQSIQNSLENTDYENEIYSKFTANNDMMRDSLGWSRDIDATTWANTEVKNVEEGLALDDGKFALEEVEEEISPAELADEIDAIFTDEANDYEEEEVSSFDFLGFHTKPIVILFHTRPTNPNLTLIDADIALEISPNTQYIVVVVVDVYNTIAIQPL